MYKHTSGKMAASLRDKQGVKVRSSLDGEVQPCGVFLYTENIPKYGDHIHLVRYFEEGGVLYMGYRMPKGMSHPLYDDVYIPTRIAAQVAQELLKLAGVAVPPVADRKKDEMIRRMATLLP